MKYRFLVDTWSYFLPVNITFENIPSALSNKNHWHFVCFVLEYLEIESYFVNLLLTNTLTPI